MIDYYEPEIVSATDYYPFGMPSRVSLTGKEYRFGFNGKENDNDVKGYANQQDYGMRIYDPRIGKFLSVDPITHKYPELTPYQFASNSPIENIDLDGFERYNYRLLLSKDGRTVIGIRRDKVIKDWIEDVIHGERHRALDPKSELLFEFEFKNSNELFKFAVGKPVDYLREASAKIAQEKIFIAATTVTALELEEELLKVGLEVSKPDNDAPPISSNSAKNNSANNGSQQKNNEGHNAAEFNKLKNRLASQERTSIYSNEGALKPEVINGSKAIMNGSELNNKTLVTKLTADGSNIADWNKMSYVIKQQTPAGEKSIDVHFYYNKATNKSYFEEDYKTKLSSDFFKQVPKAKE